MSLFEKKPLEFMFLKNSIHIVIPLVIYCVLVGFILSSYPLMDKISNHKITELSDLEDIQKQGCYNVSLKIKEAKYIGYDYMVNGHKKGGYYYTMIDGQSVFLLIRDKNTPKVLKNYKVIGKIVINNPSFDSVLSKFAVDTNLDYDDMLDLAYPRLISEIDYPYVYNIIVYVVIVLPMVVAVFIFCSSILFVFSPGKHPNGKQLLAFGTDKEAIIHEINSQIRHQLVMKTKHTLITKEYMIVKSLFVTDIIKIDYIQYISKHVNRKNIFTGRKKIYKLTMSNPEKMFYEHNFVNQLEVDKIVKELHILAQHLS